MKQQFCGTNETPSAPRYFNRENVYNQVKDINITNGKKISILGKRKCTMERDAK
jgi:hypothetical protein